MGITDGPRLTDDGFYSKPQIVFTEGEFIGSPHDPPKFNHLLRSLRKRVHDVIKLNRKPVQITARF